MKPSSLESFHNLLTFPTFVKFIFTRVISSTENTSPLKYQLIKKYLKNISQQPYFRSFSLIHLYLFNPFLPSVPFLYSLKVSNELINLWFYGISAMLH